MSSGYERDAYQEEQDHDDVSVATAGTRPAPSRRHPGESAPMDRHVVEVRNRTYRLFVDLGRAPSVAEVADETSQPPAAIQAAWRELHQAHALVLDPRTAEIRMANPFSGVPTPYRVQALGRWWYANCAWDALGICAALHSDGQIKTSCPDCGHPLSLETRDERVDDDSLLFHCLVSAAHWWDDIAFT